MKGIVEAIHLASESEAPVFAVDHVNAVTGFGLEGDRLVRAGRDAGQEVPPRRQVTLIEIEALEGLRRDGHVLSAAESRRNICTRGVALNHLVDRTFTVGAATLRGLELCEPCKTLERLAGQKGLIQGLLHRGGLRAEVVAGGRIQVGDPVMPLAME